MLLALLDPDSDLAVALEETGRAVVQLLDWRHRDLADMFAGLTPAPGGVFSQATWAQTGWGPVLADVDAWAGVSLGRAPLPEVHDCRLVVAGQRGSRGATGSVTKPSRCCIVVAATCGRDGRAPQAVSAWTNSNISQDSGDGSSGPRSMRVAR